MDLFNDYRNDIENAPKCIREKKLVMALWVWVFPKITKTG